METIIKQRKVRKGVVATLYATGIVKIGEHKYQMHSLDSAIKQYRSDHPAKGYRLETLKRINPKAYQAIITDYGNNLSHQYFVEFCEETALSHGFKAIKQRNRTYSWVTYCLSYSQGDGLSFDSEVLLEPFLRRIIPNIKEGHIDLFNRSLTVETTQNDGRYSFASRGDVSLLWNEGHPMEDFDEDEEIQIKAFVEPFVKELDDLIKCEYMALCNKLCEYGYKCFYQPEEEVIRYYRETGTLFSKEGVFIF